MGNFRNIRFVLATLIILVVNSVAFSQQKVSTTLNNELYSELGRENELKDLRNRTSKHFVLPNGKTRTVISSGNSLHYYKNGKWVDIDTRITNNEESSKVGFEYANKANEFYTYYSSSSSKGFKTTLKEGEVHEWTNVEMIFIDANGNTISSKKSVDVTGKATGNMMEYPSVFPDISAKISQNENGHKLDYILNNPGALMQIPNAAHTVVINETVAIPQGWEVKKHFVKNRRTNETSIKQVSITDSKGTAILKYGTPIYYDGTSPRTYNSTFEGNYTVSKEGNNIIIGMVVPAAWLRSSDRQFPITLDPSSTVYPSNLSKWTGTVEYDELYDSNVFLDDDVLVGWHYLAYRRHGYAKYDISGIPGGAQVSNVQQRLTATAFGDAGGDLTVEFGAYGGNSLDPTARTADQLFDDISNGTTYLTQTTFSGGTGTYTIDFTSTFNSVVNAKLASGWYAMSYFRQNTGEVDTYGYTFSGYSAGAATKPALILDYCTTPPTADAGTDKDLCNTSSVAMTGGALGAGETGLWEIESGCVGCTFSASTSPTTTVNNVPQGTNVLKWTVTASGGCSDEDQVTLNNNTPTAPDAGLPATTCESSSILSANDPAIGIGAWSVVSGTGIFTPDNNTYNATVSNLTTGANTFQWDITYNGCTHSSPDQVTITRNAVPTATISTPAASPHDLCADNMAIVANNPGGATGTWSVVSGTGNFGNANNFSTTISGLASGANTIRWTVTDAGAGCTNQDNVIINNNLPSTANAGPNITTSSTTTDMQAINPTVGVGTWTWTTQAGAAITGGEENNNNATITSISGTHVLQWCVNYAAGGCAQSCDNASIYYDPQELGLIISNDLVNNGALTQTLDPNFFVMNGGSGTLTGTDGEYTDAKLWVKGSIDFDGSIKTGYYMKNTKVNNGDDFTVNSGKTYKNETFLNQGTTNLSATSVFENRGDWTNTSTVTANATSTVKLNGVAAQTVTSGGSSFGHVEIDNDVAPSASDGVLLADAFTMNSASDLTFTDGVFLPNGQDVYINNTDNDAIKAGAGNALYKESWIYSTSSDVFRRYLANSANGDYAFPVGTATRSNLAVLTNNSLPSGAGFYIDAYFEGSAEGTINTNFPEIEESVGTSYTEVLGDDAGEGYWSLTNNGGIDGTYDLKLYFHAGDAFDDDLEDGSFGILSRPSKIADGSNWVVPTGTYVLTDVADGYTQRNGMNSFSHKAIGKAIAVLTVELTSFEVNCIDGQANVGWSTANETNNSHFIIEFSENNEYYVELTHISGTETSNTISNYSYKSNVDTDGYYRLTQVDLDGKKTIYSPVYFDNGCNKKDGDNDFDAFYSVAHGVNYQLAGVPKGNYQVRFTNVNGQTLVSESVKVSSDNFKESIPLEKIATGVYFIQVTGKTYSASKKLVIH